jgi:3-hydroxyisobutyrate dehydrogenase
MSGDREGLRVGFIGLGAMGRPMAERVIGAGFPLSVYARRPATVEPFGGRATIAMTPAILAAAADVVGVCVFGDDDVREVVAGADGILEGARRGSTVIVHSTVRPSLCVELGDLAAARDVALLDAPISGGSRGAQAGTLLTIVGGDAAVLDRARPVLDSFSATVVHAGPLGTGQAAKLLNNLMFAAHAGLLHELLLLAGRMGMSDQTMLEVLAYGSGSSGAVTALRASPTLDALLRVCQPLLKDLAMAREVVASCGGLPSALGAPADHFASLVEGAVDAAARSSSLHAHKHC